MVLSGRPGRKLPTSVCGDERSVLALAACAFWLASKLEKILAGTLRRGSGITGSGTAAVAPVVIGAFCGSDALICTLLRPFGPGFGIRTVCAAERLTTPSAPTPPILPPLTT